MRHDMGNKHNGERSLREKMKLIQSAIWFFIHVFRHLTQRDNLVTSINMSIYQSISLLIDQQ